MGLKAYFMGLKSVPEVVVGMGSDILLSGRSYVMHPCSASDCLQSCGPCRPRHILDKTLLLSWVLVENWHCLLGILICPSFIS